MAKLRPDGRARVIAALIAASATVVAALIGVARWERGNESGAGDGPTYRGIVLDQGDEADRSQASECRSMPCRLQESHIQTTRAYFVISVPANSVDTDVRMRFLMKTGTSHTTAW